MASELTLRIMQRIVDKKLGPDHNPKQAISQASSESTRHGVHISNDEESKLKQLINPAKSVQKSKTVQEFAASYNKTGSGSKTPVKKSVISKTQRMNLNDFVQTMKR